MAVTPEFTMETTLGIQAENPEKWADIFKRLRVQGFGDPYLKDKYILIKSPFITEPEIWAGLLEGLLNIKLDVKTAGQPFVFEIKESPHATSD